MCPVVCVRETFLPATEKSWNSYPRRRCRAESRRRDDCATRVRRTLVPPGHEVVMIANGPPDAVTVTFAVDVVEPTALVAVSV